MLATALTMLAMAPQGPIGTSTAPVVINEFSYDDSSTDDREYLELYNRSGGPIDISNWVVDGEDQVGPNAAYPIPAGTILQAGDYYVLGPSTGSVPNVDLQIGTTNLFENEQEAIYLRDNQGFIVDAVSYENSDRFFTPQVVEGEGFWGDFFSLDSNPLAYARIYDGYDTDDNARDFRYFTQSPGTDNNTSAGIRSANENFDSLTIGQNVDIVEATWVPMTTINPGIIDALNPTSKPLSPQGGNAAVLWDPAGGGDTARVKMEGVENVVVELFAYFEPPFDPNAIGATPQDGEAWGFGVRGMTDHGGDPRDVPGDYGIIRSGDPLNPVVDQPGASGISFYYYRTQQYARIYLVDFNNSGDENDFTIIGTPIDIVAGANDGWQRLRLEVSGPKVHANFGGTYGQDDGIRILGDTDTLGIGGVWFAYREFLLDNTLIRPLTIDALDVRESNANWGPIGTDCRGLGIDTEGLARIGNSSFAIRATNIAPNTRFAGMVLGTFQTSFPIPGGCTGWVVPELSEINFTPSGGEYVFPLPIPADPGLIGSVYFQTVEFTSAGIGQLRSSTGLQCDVIN